MTPEMVGSSSRTRPSPLNQGGHRHPLIDAQVSLLQLFANPFFLEMVVKLLQHLVDDFLGFDIFLKLIGALETRYPSRWYFRFSFDGMFCTNE